MPVKKGSKKASKIKDVNALLGVMDVVFIIDSTGSMGHLIVEAQTRVVSILQTLQTDKDLDIKVALIAYRDHPPQDYSFITQVYGFDNIDKFQTSLNALVAAGGGDAPEAVWPAVKELAALQWRENSDRIVYLIGDSPPHGFGAYGDAWPQGDPSNITTEQLISMLKELKIQLNAHSIANNAETTKAFTLLTEATGGQISVGDRAQDTTSLYESTMTTRSDSIGTSRAMYAATMASYGEYTPDSAMVTANAMGIDSTAAKDAVKYLADRGITE